MRLETHQVGAPATSSGVGGQFPTESGLGLLQQLVNALQSINPAVQGQSQGQGRDRRDSTPYTHGFNPNQQQWNDIRQTQQQQGSQSQVHAAPFHAANSGSQVPQDDVSGRMDEGSQSMVQNPLPYSRADEIDHDTRITQDQRRQEWLKFQTFCKRPKADQKRTKNGPSVQKTDQKQTKNRRK